MLFNQSSCYLYFSGDPKVSSANKMIKDLET